MTKTKPAVSTQIDKDKQYQKFVEKARELETDESEEAFDRVLKKVVKSSPPKDSKKSA